VISPVLSNLYLDEVDRMLHQLVVIALVVTGAALLAAILLGLWLVRIGLKPLRDIGLTERQAQVLALLIQGKPNKLICRHLNLAEGTVKIHVTAILKALNVMNRTQAVIAVSKLGMKLPTA
jgi:DNA-binding NarL/FixJ family response regulator